MSLLDVVSLPVFLLILNGLVFVHELGHFLAARWMGVPVEEFGLGFPPRLLGVVRDDDHHWRWFFGARAPKLNEPRTIYSLNLLPIGGFVRPRGEEDPSVPGGFSSASKRARFAVLFAGPLFNLIFALIVFAAAFMTGWPEEQTDRVMIAALVEDGPAAAAGVQVDDVLLHIDTQPITTFDQASDTIRSHLGEPITFVVERAGEQLTLTVTPRTEWPEGQGPTGIQLGHPAVPVRYGLPTALLRSGQEIYKQIDLLIHLPGMIIGGEISLEAARPSGPVAIYELTRWVVSKSIERQNFIGLIQFVGLISVALGTTNLLPLPALDGGRIVFVLIEAVRGRRIAPEREAVVHMVGMLLLLAMMVFITYQDVVNPVVPR